MGLPEAERGQESGQRERRDDGARRFTVDADETPRVSVTMINGALRVLGDAETDEVIVRAVKPNGEAVPVDLVAETQSRLNGEITIKARPAGDIHRQVRRLTKAFDGRRGDFFENLGEMTTNLGEMIDTLAAMKTLGNNLDRVRLEVTVPRRCDVALTRAAGRSRSGGSRARSRCSRPAATSTARGSAANWPRRAPAAISASGRSPARRRRRRPAAM
jgi:hypothetical protein